MKALMLVPPSFGRFDGVGARCQGTRRTKSMWYPIWLAHAAAASGSTLHDSVASGEGVEGALEYASRFDMVFIHPSEGSLPLDMKFVSRLKDAKPGVLVACGGQSATVLAREILSAYPQVDGVAIDEYDLTVKDAVGRGTLDVAGVLHRDGFEPRPKPADLDALGWVSPVYKRDLDIPSYYLPFVTRPYVQIYDSRGCTARCTFCLTPQTYTSEHSTARRSFPIRYRSVADVEAEMAYIRDSLPEVREVFIDSDTFTDHANVQSGRFYEMCAALRRVGLKWSCNVRADAKGPVLEALKRSGCRLMVVGYESMDDGVLRGIKKGVSARQAEAFTQDAERLGLMIQACFVVGLPGETRRTFEKTLRFALRHDFSNLQVAPAHAFRGTELYATASALGYIGGAMLDSKGRQLPQMSQPRFSSADASLAIEEFLHACLYRPRFLLRVLRDMGRGGGEAERILRNVREFGLDSIQRKLR